METNKELKLLINIKANLEIGKPLGKRESDFLIDLLKREFKRLKEMGLK